MTPKQAIVEKLQSSGRGVRASGEWMTTLCPAHVDTNASLGIKEDPQTGKAVVKCFAGCSDVDVLKAIGLDVRDLFPTAPVTRNAAALTVDQLATAKKLSTEYLRNLGLKEYKGGIVIPYFAPDHSAARARLRLALSGDDRFRWGYRKSPRGQELKQIPYGLWKIDRANKNLILVEGESDCWSGWLHGLNVLGLPGAETARLLEAEHLNGIERIYIVQEPDHGGEAFINGVAARLKAINFKGQAFYFNLGAGVKDLSELHMQCGVSEIFRQVVRAGVECAQLLPEPMPIKRAPSKPPVIADGKDTAAPAARRELRNHEVFTFSKKDGSIGEGIRALPITEISKNLLSATGNWPRRIDSLLFVDEGGKIRHLEDRDALFAWIHEKALVSWANGQDDNGNSLITKAEFIAHLQVASQHYAAVEEFPHEPPMENHYYAWRPQVNCVATGEYFNRLVALFDNAESPCDRTLIRAAFMTPCWGGLPGKRPALVIMACDRGHGKSTLANAIGLLFGGHIELQLTHTAEDKLTSRLLTPSALARRVVRIDNIKEEFGSAPIEALITAPIISGHRLYHGEASRPNTLTFVLTGNSLRLSRDIAERAFIIRLIKPTYRPEWESEVMNFISAHRDAILMDILAELKKSAATFTESARYAEWAKGVLAHCGGDTDATILQNKDRCNACDEDQDDASAIMAAIDQHIDKISVTDSHVFVASSHMTSIVSDALHEQLSSKAVRARLMSHLEAGRFTRVNWKRGRSSNGYIVQRQNGSTMVEDVEDVEHSPFPSIAEKGD